MGKNMSQEASINGFVGHFFGLVRFSPSTAAYGLLMQIFHICQQANARPKMVSAKFRN